MAVGLGVPEKMAEMNEELSDDAARAHLDFLGKFLKGSDFSLNPMSGIEGDFYRDNRKEDILYLCRELLKEREVESSESS